MSMDLFSHVLKTSTEVDPTRRPGSTSQCLPTPTAKNFLVPNQNLSCCNLCFLHLLVSLSQRALPKCHYNVFSFSHNPAAGNILKQETVYFVCLGSQICLGFEHALGMTVMGIHHPQLTYASERAKRCSCKTTNSPKYFFLTNSVKDMMLNQTDLVQLLLYFHIVSLLQLKQLQFNSEQLFVHKLYLYLKFFVSIPGLEMFQ